MNNKQGNLQGTPPQNDLATAPAWVPRRGDLAYDAATRRTGVVIAIPEDTGADVHHLRPEGGGSDWTACAADLTPPPPPEPPAGPEPPVIGSILNTIQGRQRVMDVLYHPHDEPTVYLRPEYGGLEWTVPVAGLSRVIRP